MALVKVFFVIAAMMILTVLTLNLNLNYNGNTATDQEMAINQADLKLVKLPKRFSRFLMEQKNRRASDHCKKDNGVCFILEAGKISTCCNNKCADLTTDSNNCGACKNKCKYTETCCGGQCVNLASNGTNCGVCGNVCMPGGYCLNGMCDYA